MPVIGAAGAGTGTLGSGTGGVNGATVGVTGSGGVGLPPAGGGLASGAGATAGPAGVPTAVGSVGAPSAGGLVAGAAVAGAPAAGAGVAPVTGTPRLTVKLQVNGALLSAARAEALIPDGRELVGAGQPDSAARPNDEEVELLTRAATRHLQRGNTALACSLLAQAFSVTHGTVELAALASCEEKAGRTTTAWLAHRAVAAAGNSPVAAGSRRAEARLGSALPRLQLSLKRPPTGELRVLLDDAAVPESAWGRPIPVDPGVHRLTLRGGAGAPTERRLELPRAANTVAVSWPPTVLEEKPWYISGRVVVAGGFTVLFGAVSAALGLWTMDAKKAFDERNGQPGFTREELTALRDTAKDRALFTNVGLGATALGAAVTTLFIVLDSGPPKERPVELGFQPWVSGDGAGLGVGGRL